MVGEARTSRELLLAAVLVGVEALIALTGAGALAFLTLIDTPASYGLALAGVALGLLAAAVLGKAALALRRAEPWARGPAVVTQLLLLPVGWTLAATNDRPAYGVPLLVLAVLGLGLLLSPGARAALEAD